MNTGTLALKSNEQFVYLSYFVYIFKVLVKANIICLSNFYKINSQLFCTSNRKLT